MQKTRLGISVALMGMIIFVCAFISPLTAIIVAGYALIAEDNPWLKRAAVKAVVLIAGFTILSVLIGLIPQILGVIGNFLYIFGVNFSISFITKLVSFIRSAVDLAETVIYLILAFKALSQSTIRIPVIDNLINSNMG